MEMHEYVLIVLVGWCTTTTQAQPLSSESHSWAVRATGLLGSLIGAILFIAVAADQSGLLRDAALFAALIGAWVGAALAIELQRWAEGAGD